MRSSNQRLGSLSRTTAVFLPVSGSTIDPGAATKRVSGLGQKTISGKTFRLLYGYYENFERESPFCEPMPIYPDFTKEPHYTAEGIPMVTAMQSVCALYEGKNDEDSTCVDCAFFQKSEELFGFCNCPQNRKAKSL